MTDTHDAAPREFPDRPAAASAPSPADDRPMTIRADVGERDDYAARFDPTVLRAMLVDIPSAAAPWVVIGPAQFAGNWLPHERVAGWTAFPWACAAVAMDRAAAARGAAPATPERRHGLFQIMPGADIRGAGQLDGTDAAVGDSGERWFR